MKRSARLARRTPMPRGKSLARGKTELRRRARIRPVTKNAAKRAARHERQYGPAGYAEWLRSLGCVLPGCRDERIECAHVRSRGAGGDWTDMVPMCSAHHRMLHVLGVETFQRGTGLDLADLAAQHVLRWRAFAGQEPEAAEAVLDVTPVVGSEERF